MLKYSIVITLSFVFFLELLGCATSSMADRSQVKRPEEKPASERNNPPSEKKNTPSAPVRVNYGKAAFYSESARGKITASGEAYDPTKLTAAHVSLPFGSICRVTSMNNGRTVDVRINDRFSGSRGRIILLSYEAASRLDAIRAGVIEVKVEVLKTPNY